MSSCGGERGDLQHAGVRGRWNSMAGTTRASIKWLGVPWQVVGSRACVDDCLSFPRVACNVRAVMRVLRMQQTGNEVALPWERARDVLRHWATSLMT